MGALNYLKDVTKQYVPKAILGFFLMLVGSIILAAVFYEFGSQLKSYSLPLFVIIAGLMMFIFIWQGTINQTTNKLKKNYFSLMLTAILLVCVTGILLHLNGTYGLISNNLFTNILVISAQALVVFLFALLWFGIFYALLKLSPYLILGISLAIFFAFYVPNAILYISNFVTTNWYDFLLIPGIIFGVANLDRSRDNLNFIKASTSLAFRILGLFVLSLLFMIIVVATLQNNTVPYTACINSHNPIASLLCGVNFATFAIGFTFFLAGIGFALSFIIEELSYYLKVDCLNLKVDAADKLGYFSFGESRTREIKDVKKELNGKIEWWHKDVLDTTIFPAGNDKERRALEGNTATKKILYLSENLKVSIANNYPKFLEGYIKLHTFIVSSRVFKGLNLADESSKKLYIEAIIFVANNYDVKLWPNWYNRIEADGNKNAVYDLGNNLKNKEGAKDMLKAKAQVGRCL